MRHQGKIVGICIASNRKGHLLKYKKQKLKILRKKQQTMSFSFMSILYLLLFLQQLTYVWKLWLKEQTFLSIVNFYVVKAKSFPKINLKPGLGIPRLCVTAVVEGCFQNTIIGKGCKVLIVSWALGNDSCISSAEIFCKDEYIFLIN